MRASSKNTPSRLAQREKVRKHFQELAQMASIWLPSEPIFREAVNKNGEEALSHFLKHGDTTKIKSFVTSLPSEVDGLCVLDYIKKFAPIHYSVSPMTSGAKISIHTIKDHTKKQERYKPPSEFNLFSERKLSKKYICDFGEKDDDLITIQVKALTRTDFVQLILDGLVEKRRLFSADDIEEILQILVRLKSRIR